MRIIKIEEPKILHSYINGNTSVTIYDDGTKVRETEDDDFRPIFPENIDVKITNCCKWGCPFCHENSLPNGEHGDVHHPIFDSLTPGTELAIGGGNIFDHPEIDYFLERLKDRGIISNITVNQKDMYSETKIEKINHWMKNKLVYGVGISWDGTDVEDIIKKLTNPNNVVIHTIAGVHDLTKFKNPHKLKVLILGYKTLRRGVNYKSNNFVDEKIKNFRENIKEIMAKFKVMSFDNLAIEQLDMKNNVSEEDWKNHYMGDDGTHTMYIDLPNNEFASSSTSSIRYKLNGEKDIKNIFKTITQEKKS